MTSSSSLSPTVSGICKELAEMRHLVQFPEEIACILTEQEQLLYQQVGGTYTHVFRVLFSVSTEYLFYCVDKHAS